MKTEKTEGVFSVFLLKEDVMKDIIIIGAGIIGGTIAYELGKYDLDVLVLEKAAEAGTDVTRHNSAIIHNGTDPKAGTLKEKYNIEGSKMYEAYAKELNVPYRKVGAFVLATHPEDRPHLEELIENAKARDVFVELLTKEEALALEPNLSDDVIEVLNMPTVAIVEPALMAQHAIAKAIENGIKVNFNETVKDIKKLDEGFEVITDKGTYQTRAVVNAAGLFAPEIEKMVSEPTFELHFIRGDYIMLSSEAMSMSSRVLYPTAGPKGKGVLVVPTVHDAMLIGPTAVEVYSPEDDSWTPAAIDDIKEKMPFLLKHVPYELEIMKVSGIRPKASHNDFIIEESPHVKNFFNLAGIDSPGVSAAPAIATDFVHRILKNKA